MDEIINFVKEIFMIENPETSHVGLCSFRNTVEPKKKEKRVRPKKASEMRLSELIRK